MNRGCFEIHLGDNDSCIYCKHLKSFIGKEVKKKSGKPFQNKLKKATIESITTMTIPFAYPNKHIMKTVDAVYLEGCKGKVRFDILEMDIKE